MSILGAMLSNYQQDQMLKAERERNRLMSGGPRYPMPPGFKKVHKLMNPLDLVPRNISWGWIIFWFIMLLLIIGAFK